MDTLLLDTDSWDLISDAAGNIARATKPYAIAQDVASAIRTFRAEVFYDTTLGVPYFQSIFGKSLPTAIFQEYLVQAALTVPGVVKASVVISSFSNRAVTGQVLFTDSDKQTATVSF